MSAATITTKGQITIPKNIRAELKLQAGDKIDFVIAETGEVRFVPITKDVRSLKGIVAKPSSPVSIEDMKRSVRNQAGRK